MPKRYANVANSSQPKGARHLYNCVCVCARFSCVYVQMESVCQVERYSETKLQLTE